MSATTSSDHLDFVHSWWLLTETRPSKAKKESDERFECCCYSCFFYVAASLFVAVSFHTSWPSIYNGRNCRLICRSSRIPEIHFGSFGSPCPTATLTIVFSTFDSTFRANFIQFRRLAELISIFIRIHRQMFGIGSLRNSFRVFRLPVSNCHVDHRVQHLRLSFDRNFHPIWTIG